MTHPEHVCPAVLVRTAAVREVTARLPHCYEGGYGERRCRESCRHCDAHLVRGNPNLG